MVSGRDAEYQQFVQQASACTACQLSRTRTQVVVGDGPINAKVVLIGEAPGYNEDQQGLPFVGAAGKFLTELLASIGLKRSDVYICNVIKCRPPDNRDPLPGEIDACSKWLDWQLSFIKPRVIVTMGRYSVARFFPRETISKLRGKPYEKDGVITYPIFHPAAALHNNSLRRTIEEDFKKIPELVKQAETLSAAPAGPQPAPKQLGLF